jgi:hypothetical protein
MSDLIACHWLLLRIAGIASDDLVHRCRAWLTQRRLLDVGRAVSYAVLSQRIRLGDADIDLLAELLAADGVDTSALSMIAVDDVDPMPRYGFAATRAGIGRGSGISAADAPPTELVTNAEAEDDIEAQTVRHVSADASARALWRSWRFPGDGAPWPPPRRIWVIETDADANLPEMAGRIQAALQSVGEELPQVEVYPIGAEPPSYQLLARAYGALMWSREPDTGIRMAPVLARSVRLDALESDRVDAYLSAGVVVRIIAARADDLLTPDRRDAVPMSLVTDGAWIWSEATRYYLRTYGLAPDAGLLAHIRSCAYQSRPVDGASLYRAMAFVRDPSLDALIGPPRSG